MISYELLSEEIKELQSKFKNLTDEDIKKQVENLQQTMVSTE